MSKRKWQWIDNIESALISVGATSIVNTTQVSEAEIENLGGAMTLTRVVGTICPVAGSTPSARLSYALHVLQSYAGAVAPTSWVNDTFQRLDMLGCWWWTGAGVASGPGIPRAIHVDLRTKRKIGQGVQIELAVENFGGFTCTYTSHLRFLMQLP